MSEDKKPVEATEVADAKEAVAKNIFADYDFDGLELSMQAMLAAGVHFGHPKARRHPKMNDFIFTTRNNVNIIDLAKTVELTEAALGFLKEVKGSGKKILFVATKKQAQSLTQQLAEFTDNPYVIERWLGGTLTNFKNIRGRVKYMGQLREQFAKDELGRYTKLERLKKSEELAKLTRRMGGIEIMEDKPGAVFVTDILADNLAIKEAQKLGIPVVGFSDTNANPELIDYPIPANDDAISSLEYMLAQVAKTLK